MSNTISLTIPRDDETALVAGATLLLTLAGKVPAMELPDMRDPYVGCGGEVKIETTQIEATPEQNAVAMRAANSDPVPPPPTATNSTPANPDLDADGMPWDARIHSGNKTQTQDGCWKKKRGVDKEDYEQVIDELRQLMSVPVAPITDDVPPPPPVEQPADDIPPPPPVAEEPATDGTLATFTEFLKAVSHRIQAKEITMDDVNGALPEGVANLQLLNGRQDLIPQVWAKLVNKQ